MRPSFLALAASVVLTGACDTDAPPADSDSDSDARLDRDPIGPLPVDFEPVGDEFIVAFIPDTQIYAWRFPETFDEHMKWLADWADDYNIVFVSHVGDIVQNAAALDQWTVARASFDRLDDIGLPYGTSNGGHDVADGQYRDRGDVDTTCSTFGSADCEATEYVKNFGPDAFAGADWYMGASPSKRSNYQIVEAGGLRLLFLHLPQDVPADEMAWAHTVLDAHPDALAHVTTHRYMFDYRLTEWLPTPLDAEGLRAGRFNDAIYLLGGQDVMYTDGHKAEEIWTELVSAHPNVWSVHCGHVDAEFRQISTNSAGLPVHETLIDYQDMSDGGGGWLRLLKYSPSKNKVSALTFSTKTLEVRENGGGFDHAIGILDAYRHEAESFLAAFGYTQEDLDALLASVQPGGENREAYYDSLYGDGARDSRYELTVDLQAYLDAAK